MPSASHVTHWSVGSLHVCPRTHGLPVPPHTPLVHESVAVQNLPSSQLVPVKGVCTQAPALHPSVVHASPSPQSPASLHASHAFATSSQSAAAEHGVPDPTHTPALHESVAVQKSPSSQIVPLKGVCTQAPALQPSVVHALPSSQCAGVRQATHRSAARSQYPVAHPPQARVPPQPSSTAPHSPALHALRGKQHSLSWQRANSLHLHSLGQLPQCSPLPQVPSPQLAAHAPQSPAQLLQVSPRLESQTASPQLATHALATHFSRSPQPQSEQSHVSDGSQ
jgi:hypothetical protein